MDETMSFRDSYARANKNWEQSFENGVDELSNVLEYEAPLFNTNQMSSSPYPLTLLVNPDQAQYECGYSQPYENSLYTFEYQIPPPSDPNYANPQKIPLTCLAITTPTSLPNPTPSNYSKEQAAPVLAPCTPGPESIVQREKPKQSPYNRTYSYKPLNIAPANWDIFAYNNFGELEPGKTYSTDEIKRYLYRNPQHYLDETYNPKFGGLTVWIQRTPQDSALKLGHAEAGLCRFADCEHNNVIKAGDVRVAFDELTKFLPDLNPQHNAGFVHLSCLEKKIDFPQLCIDLDVRPEDRVFPVERTRRNHMMLRDRNEFDHVQRLITFCIEKGRPPLSYQHNGYLFIEIGHLEPKKSTPTALSQWKRWGVERDDENKARTLYSKEKLMNRRRDAKARKIALKRKRALEEEEEEEEDSERKSAEERRREKTRAITIAMHDGYTRYYDCWQPQI